MKTHHLELAVAKYFDYRDHIVVPNIHWGFDLQHECDLVVLTESLYLYEVELKVSKGDLLEDFKKSHGHRDYKNRIRKFFYAVPEDLQEVALQKIPNHAGLLVARPFSTIKDSIRKIECVRAAKVIPESRKITESEKLKLLRLAQLRTWSLKEKIIKMERHGHK